MARKDCPSCEGTGWKLVDVQGVMRAARCACSVDGRPADLMRRAGIPRRYEHCTIESFNVVKELSTGQPNFYLDMAKRWAQQFVDEYRVDFGLIFTGPTGVGKTHLAVAVLRDLITRKGVECQFVDFRELLKSIRKSYEPVSDTSEFQLLEPAVETEVLLLDEVVSANPSDFEKDRLAYIINSRYNHKRVTLITTTLFFGEPAQPRNAGKEPSGNPIPSFERSLDQFGVTLSSRIYEMCKPIEIRGEDFRKTIKQAGYRFQAD